MNPNEKHSLTKYVGRMQEAVQSIFEDSVNYFFLTGSSIYREHLNQKTDIDLTIVCDNGLEDFEKRVSKFSTFFIKFQKDNGFTPDYEWPGEIITLSHVVDSILGRGFSVSTDMLYLPRASDEYYLMNRNHEYRAWLSQSCFSQFIGGDFPSYETNRKEAWTSAVMFSLSRATDDEITTKEIMKRLIGKDDKWEGFGIHSGYFNFERFETESLNEIIEVLEERSVVQSVGNKLLLNRADINKWVQEVIFRHENNLWNRS